jgi:hypothetical protein
MMLAGQMGLGRLVTIEIEWECNAGGIDPQ